MSADPLDVDLARPNTWLQPTTAREPDGKEVNLPRFERHLLCDEDGLFPANFNSWEDGVLLAELQRPGTIAWYRNPARASQDSLGVTYEDGDEIKIVRPDFVFFAQRQDGSIVADIVDPHGIQFGDALPRLKGLARYAEENPGIYRRIEVVARVGSKFRAIDLTEASERAAFLAAKTVREVYERDVAIDYSA
jgi:type III restriction enzyme